MKHLLPLCCLVGSLGLGSLQANASPTIYISNQTCFESPLVYVYGFGTPGDYGTYFDFGYDGYSKGQVTVDGITYDKFPLPDDAIGKTANVQYSDSWRYTKPDYEVTFEDKDYYLLANANGIQEVVAGGTNEYFILFLDNQTTIDADKNSLKVYAVADDGSELFGPYPGIGYGSTRMVDGTGFYIYAMPKADKPYKFTFSNEDCGFKQESDFTHTPSGHAFVTVKDNATENLGNLFAASTTVGKIDYTLDKLALTAEVDGLTDPTEDVADLVIPSTVTFDSKEYRVVSIKAGAFKGLRNLTGTLTLGDNLEIIGNDAFNGCQNLTGPLAIGDKVTTIGNNAFTACLGFNGDLTIGNSVVTIGDDAFLMCSGLKGSIVLPESVKTIGESAFSGCRSLDGTLTFSEGVTTIGAGAFTSCASLTGDLTLPQSLTSIGANAFMGCSGFDGQLTLPSGLTIIPDNLFFNCTGLTGSLTIPAGVTAISDGAFYSCSGLTGSLSIPSSVTAIGKSAFFNCSGFNGSLELGANILTIGDGAFNGCSKFFGWLTLPANLQSIGDNAFYGCEKFSGPLTIPDNVTSIGALAFGMCEGFKGKLTLGESLTSIGEQAFVSCPGFTGTLSIPEGVTTLGFRTFAWCWGLTSLQLPASLQSLGNLVFYGCWNLESVTCEAETAPLISDPDKAFDSDSYTKATLYVPAAGFQSYKTGYEWSDFAKIVAVGGIAPTEITLSQTEATVIVDETVTLTAEVLPEDTTDKTLTWQSSDEEVATVADGVVKGVSEGTAKITVTCGDVTAECTITVISKSALDSISADAAGEVEYYSLQGIRILNPQEGEIVIEKRGSSIRKTVFSK